MRRDAEDSEPGYDGMAWGQDPDGQLIAWAPGMLAREGLAGSAWRLQPNSYFVLHSHLQPSGKPETVQFRIGLYFSDELPRVQPAIVRIGSRDIDIPPDVNRILLSIAIKSRSIWICIRFFRTLIPFARKFESEPSFLAIRPRLPWR